MVSFKETTQARNADTKMFKRGIKFLHKNQKKDYLKGRVAILHSPKTEVVVVDLEIQL